MNPAAPWTVSKGNPFPNEARLLLVTLGFALGSILRAAPAPDATFANGLDAFVSNGLEAGLRTWYPDRPAAAASANEALLVATRNLGEITGTEVFAVQTVSKRVTRYYVALYFTLAPVW